MHQLIACGALGLACELLCSAVAPAGSAIKERVPVSVPELLRLAAALVSALTVAEAGKTGLLNHDGALRALCVCSKIEYFRPFLFQPPTLQSLLDVNGFNSTFYSCLICLDPPSSQRLSSHGLHELSPSAHSSGGAPVPLPLVGSYARVGEFTGHEVDAAIRQNACQTVRQVVEHPDGQRLAGQMLLDWYESAAIHFSCAQNGWPVYFFIF